MNKTSMIMLVILGFLLAISHNFTSIPAPKLNNNLDYTVSGYGQSDIVVFTTDWCPSCKEVKEILNKNNITYIELDVDSQDDIESEYRRLGGEYIPYIIYQGQVIDYHSEKGLLKILNPS